MLTSSSVSTALAHRGLLVTSWWCARYASANCQPTVNTGFSELIGSWKIMEMPLPRKGLHLLVGQADQLLVTEPDRAADVRALGQQPP